MDISCLTTHKICVMSDQPGDRNSECPPIPVWQGCANIQRVSAKRRTVYLQDNAGEPIEPGTYIVSLPKNVITRQILQKPPFWFVSLQEDSLYYKTRFESIQEPMENTLSGNFYLVLCKKEACPACALINWCDLPPDCQQCANGIYAEFDPDDEDYESLLEFINCQAVGTCIGIPDGTFDAGQIDINYIKLVPSENTVINGDWTYGLGVVPQ